MAKLKPPNPAIEFGDTIEDTVVPDSVVRMWSKLAGVRKAMARLYGADWGNEELRLYVARREWEKKIAWEAASNAGLVGGGMVGERKSASALDTTMLPKGEDIEAAVQRVMDSFPDLTEANRPMVRQREYYNRVLEQLAKRLQAGLADKGDAGHVRQTQQMLIDIQKEARQIEKDLRLDAGSLRSGGIEELRAEIIKVMDRSKALLNKHAIRIMCPACMASRQERHINLGWLLYHFRQDKPFHFFTICPYPDCDQAIHIYGGPGQETVIENGPKTIGPLKG